MANLPGPPRTSLPTQTGVAHPRPTKPRIRITIRHGHHFHVHLGDGPAQLTDGFEGWEEVERPDNLPITEWNGTAALKMDVPVLLDGFADHRNVQHELTRLEHLGRRIHPDHEPPSFRVDGPVPYSGRRWILQNLTFGDAERDDYTGKLIRQWLTLNLMEPVRGEKVKFKRRRRSHADDHDLFYRTHHGDTIKKIVAKQYNDRHPHWVRAMLKLNHLRDPRKKLKAGQKLRLP